MRHLTLKRETPEVGRGSSAKKIHDQLSENGALAPLRAAKVLIMFPFCFIRCMPSAREMNLTTTHGANTGRNRTGRNRDRYGGG